MRGTAPKVCVCWIDMRFEFVVGAVGKKKKDNGSGTQKLAVKALQGACQ